MKLRVWIVCALLMNFCGGICLAADEGSVGAIGRIMPERGIVNITSRSYEPIESIVVEEGAEVARGDTLFVLTDNKNTLYEYQLAKMGLTETRQLGEKAIELQQKKIEAAENDYAFALRRFERFKEIGGDSISIQQMEERQYQVDSTDLARQMAARELERLTLQHEFRVKRAERELAAAEMRLAQSYVISPINGTILELLRNVGENAGGGSLARIANLNNCIVIAEVYEGDVAKIEIGMKATVSSNSLSADIEGRVESIGRIISGESNIAKVRIGLRESAEASRFINMETNIVIHLK